MVAARADRENGTTSPAVTELSHVLPRVLIVSRRTVRKNKFVDFVGEYHLDLIVKYGACPVIVPRVMGLQSLLDSFEPIHGVLLCEGEDIDPSHYENDAASLSPAELDEIKEAHASDAAIDHAKDSIELQLARRCLERNIPYMGICRGSQVLNVACGGSLYLDVETELTKRKGLDVKHIDYLDYDGHRHPITVVKDTPLYDWFRESLEERGRGEELLVNSYHHQGVRRLAARFCPMAHAPDGLIEAFYDPDCHAPQEGKFIVGLQFHPERMQHEATVEGTGAAGEAQAESVFDYPECPRAYQEFITAVMAYQRRLSRQDSAAGDGALASKTPGSASGEPGGGASPSGPRPPGPVLDASLEQQRQDIVRSFRIARQVYDEQVHLKRNSSVHDSSQALQALSLKRTNSQQDLSPGAEFLQGSTPLGGAAVRRLKAMGATVRNSSLALLHLQTQSEPPVLEKAWGAGELDSLEGLSEEELRKVLAYHQRMARAAEQALEAKGAQGH